jgi:hypothetical protein
MFLCEKCREAYEPIHDSVVTKSQVKELAEQFGCCIYRVIENNGVMLQMAEQSESWLCLWSTGWHETEQAALSATYQHLKECEQMNVFSTKLFPYLEGLMIKDKPVTLTIKGVTQEELTSQRGKEVKIIVHFQERDKSLILNKTNTKQIVKFFGPETNDWRGRKVTLYAEKGTWFGVEGYAVRVDARLPKQDAAPVAKQNAKSAPVVIDELTEDEFITAEQAELMAVTYPGAHSEA